MLVYWYLPNHRTTWNDLKQLETSYNEQEMILNNLQQARSNLKRPGTTFNEQETTWNDLSWARNDLQEAKNNLKKPEKTYFNFMEPLNLINNQLKSFNVTKKQWISSVIAIFRIIRAYAKWWQTEISKQMSETNEAKQKNIEWSLD